MKRKILVVDDDQSILEALEVLLSEMGYDVAVVRDASHLPTVLKKVQPDLLLLDLLLSGTDGRDIARDLKANPVTKKLPIIMMSADTHVKEKAAEAKVDNYIKKPFDIDDLEILIAQHLPKS